MDNLAKNSRSFSTFNSLNEGDNQISPDQTSFSGLNQNLFSLLYIKKESFAQPKFINFEQYL